MTIPAFTADASLYKIKTYRKAANVKTGEASTTIYLRRSPGPVEPAAIAPPGLLEAPSLGGGLGRPYGWDRCFVNCIQHGGGSDPGMQIALCTSICTWNPWVVF